MPEKGRLKERLLIPALLFAGLLLGLVVAPYLGALSPGARGIQEVTVAVAAKNVPGGSQPILSAGGYVIARFQVEVGSKITGRVVALEIMEGDQVAQGQVIARLDDHEITAQVREARANLAANKARLAELEAGSRPQEIQRATAQVAKAEADRKNSELNLRRMEHLVKEEVVEKQVLDDALARYDMARAEHRAAVEDLELARIGPRQEAIDLARAQVEQSQAALAFIEAQHENTIIRAPISGTILDRYVDLGEMVTTGFTSDRGAKQALVSIADLEDLQVELDISEADISQVRLGQPTVIRPDAYPERHYKGRVEYIASVADRQKATIQVKVKILNPDGYLRPDMGAKVAFHAEGSGSMDGSSAVVIPTGAIRRQQGKSVVYLVRDSSVVVQSIEVGKEHRGFSEILSGLQGGESIITGEHISLQEGDRITIKQ